jgi:hypothetical protein
VSVQKNVLGSYSHPHERPDRLDPISQFNLFTLFNRPRSVADRDFDYLDPSLQNFSCHFWTKLESLAL